MLNYVDLANLRLNADFCHRVEIAVAKYALYILNEAPNASNHATRYRWAITALTNVQGIAASLSAGVVLHDLVNSVGASADDSAVQAAVETVINSLLM